MSVITRYDINDAGEIPLSTGRLCLLANPLRWEDGYADAEQEFRED